jgi:hypothetical protein
MYDFSSRDVRLMHTSLGIPKTGSRGMGQGEGRYISPVPQSTTSNRSNHRRVLRTNVAFHRGELLPASNACISGHPPAPSRARLSPDRRLPRLAAHRASHRRIRLNARTYRARRDLSEIVVFVFYYISFDVVRWDSIPINKIKSDINAIESTQSNRIR